MTKTQNIIKDAVLKGYRVTADGRLVGLKKEIKIKLHGKSRYPTVSVSTKLTNSKVYGIPLHHLAAFCFYGDKAFSKGVVVRHLNGNVLDVSKRNIVLGSHSENNLDKPKSVRINAAKIARASQGRTPNNAKLSLDDREKIKRMYATSSYQELATLFNVSKATIANLINGKTYV